MTFTELFTAALLALGPSPRDEASNEMTAYQLNLLKWCEDAGVKKLDDHEYRTTLLAWYFMWEAANEKP